MSSGGSSQTPNSHQPAGFLLPSLLAFLAGMAVTALFWSLLPDAMRENESGDYLLFYEPVARNILRGDGITLTDGEIAMRYPPGYPILLAGVFAIARYTGIPESIGIAVFTLTCMGFSSLILYRFSADVWGARFAWLSPILFLTYPLVLWLAKQPNSEVPFMAALYGSVYLYWLASARRETKPALFVMVGILAGVAMMIRPIAFGLGILLAFLLLFTRHHSLKTRLFMSVLLITGNLLVILPWQALVYSNTGSFILLSTGGVTSIRDGLTFAAISKEYRTDIIIPQDVEGLQEDIAQVAPQLRTLGDVVRLMSGYFVGKPVPVIELYLVKAARSWYATDSGRYETPLLGIQIAYGILILTSVVLAWHRLEGNRCLPLLMGCVVVYFWLMTIAVLSIVRYMTPPAGLLFLFPPGAVQYLYARFHPQNL